MKADILLVQFQTEISRVHTLTVPGAAGANLCEPQEREDLNESHLERND